MLEIPICRIQMDRLWYVEMDVEDINFLHHSLLNKVLFKVYTIKLIIHKRDRPHGVINISVGILISISFSLKVQLDNVIILTRCDVIIICIITRCDIIKITCYICYIHLLFNKWYVRIFSDCRMVFISV